MNTFIYINIINQSFHLFSSFKVQFVLLQYIYFPVKFLICHLDLEFLSWDKSSGGSTTIFLLKNQRFYTFFLRCWQHIVLYLWRPTYTTTCMWKGWSRASSQRPSALSVHWLKSTTIWMPPRGDSCLMHLDSPLPAKGPLCCVVPRTWVCLLG